MKLHQIIALVGGKKPRVERLKGDVHHGWKDVAISGMSRTYRPFDENGTKLPGEEKHVQTRVHEELPRLVEPVGELIDLISMQEAANTAATGEVKIDGLSLGKLPVCALLAIEKQLVDLQTLISKVPTLPPDKKWRWDKNLDVFVSDPEKSVRTQKRFESLLLVAPTEHHPGQAQPVPVDDPVGEWTVVHHSGAISKQDQREMLERISKLIDEVKMARERANDTEVPTVSIGKSILEYVIGKRAQQE